MGRHDFSSVGRKNSSGAQSPVISLSWLRESTKAIQAQDEQKLLFEQSLTNRVPHK